MMAGKSANGSRMDLSPNNRISGVLTPTFALRSEGDQGIGDTQSVIEFLDWAAGAGFAVVQLLPINEMGGDHSPYNALSARALDPMPLRVTPSTTPDLEPGDYERIMRQHGGIGDSPTVDYARVSALKHDLLQAAFGSFQKRELTAQSDRAREFARFADEQRDWLPDYELFRALRDEHRGVERWSDWPLEHRTLPAARTWLGTLADHARKSMEERMTYFRYTQWIAFAQWEKVHEHAERLGVALMGDIPFGVSVNSAEVWAHPEFFDLDWCAGTPPDAASQHDPFVQKWGQNWGLPLYRWDGMRADNFEWWRARVRGVRAFFHLFRIDHILGFYRVYAFPWSPDENNVYLPLDVEAAQAHTNGRLPQFLPHPDDTPEHCQSNRESGERYLRAVLEEAGPGKVVGEDLGVVPDYVRPSLAELGIAGYKVPQWEKGNDERFIEGSEYARFSVATYGTHDHEPLRKQWEDMQRAPPQDPAVADTFRHWREYAQLPTDQATTFEDAHPALLRALLRSNAWLAMIMITDVLGDTRRFNAPGVGSDDNWTQRLPISVRDLPNSGGSCLVQQLIGEERGSGRPSNTKQLPSHDAVAQRAFFIGLEQARSGQPNDAGQNWAQAERELAPP
jgi:4-alpha-glucanotransferase